MVKIENPIARLSKPVKQETSLTSVPDWRWCINHVFDGPNRLSGLSIASTDFLLAKSRAVDPLQTEQIEKNLPYAIALAGEISQGVISLIKSSSPEDLVKIVRATESLFPEKSGKFISTKTMDQQSLKNLMQFLIDANLPDFKSLETAGWGNSAKIAKNANRPLRDTIENMGRIFDASGLNRLRLGGSLVPATADGRAFPIYGDNQSKAKRMIEMAGLIESIKSADRSKLIFLGLGLGASLLASFGMGMSGMAGGKPAELVNAIPMLILNAYQVYFLTELTDSDFIKDFQAANAGEKLLAGLGTFFGAIAWISETKFIKDGLPGMNINIPEGDLLTGGMKWGFALLVAFGVEVFAAQIESLLRQGQQLS